jgi:5-methyltetrahydropteroyltriglutamate--homocysteine methyltransferase
MHEAALFPTMVIGSLPRPRWVLDLVRAREAGLIGEARFQAAVDPAVRFAIALQEQADIDVIADGEWRRLTYFTGFARAVRGFAPDVIAVTLLDGTTRRWPGVVDRLRYAGPIALDEVRFLKAHTTRRVKATLPSPYMVERWFYDPDASRAAYPTRDELVRDAADVLRREVLALRDLGVDMIQFDDAMVGRFVGEVYNPTGTNPKVRISMADRDRELEMAVWGLNRVLAGIEGVTTALHVCRGHRARRHAASGGFEPIVPYLYRSRVDILALELAAPDAGGVESLGDFPPEKRLGLGVIDVLSPDVDDVATVKRRVTAALRRVHPSQLILNPDCGFAPGSDNPISLDEAYLKLKAVSAAARELREERKPEPSR